LIKFAKPGGRVAVDVYRKAWEIQPYKSKYLWRPLTTRVERGKLFRFISWYVPLWLPIDTIIKKLPLVGNFFGMLIPCWNYSFLPLTSQQKIEWAILDTFDALAPVYDLPQREQTMRRWFEAALLCDIDVRIGGNGVIGNGRVSAAAVAQSC
jgi:hypothetical protein